MGDESRLERVALNIPARSLNDERSASPSSLQHRLRQGDLLKRSDVRSLCHLPALANDNMMLHTYAGVEEDMHGGHIDVTVQSLAEGLRHCPQAVHIFVSWMLPFKDDAMETTRLAALQELGASCWLPDGMEDYERQRSFSCGSPVPENSLSRTPPLHTRPRSCNSKTSGTRMESWVEMLEKDTYSDFKGNLEGYKWPPVMHTLFNGSTRRLLQGKPEDDFASTLYRKGGPREAIQRWILVRLFLPLHPSPSSAAQTGASPSMLDHVGAGHLVGNVHKLVQDLEIERTRDCGVVPRDQGIWVEEVGAASLAKTLITVRQRERLCFRYVSNPIAMFALDGRCVYQNPESMKLHGDLRDHRHNSTASGALDAELAELWLDDEEEDSETDEEWAWTCAGETMDALHDAIFRGNSRLYEEMKRRTLEGREQYSCEIRSTDPRQRRVAWHRVVSTWARDPLTGEACVVVTETDITDKKQLERELHLHRSGQTAHDQEITDKIWDLRERFGILQDEGFVLGGERIPKRLRRESLVFLRRSQLESAARMALRMPFAATAFDAFVFCIKDAVVRSEADQSAVSPYAKVCEWVLEVAQRLVAPPVQSELRTEQDGSAESEEERQRWDYFAESVLALRIWEEPSMLPRLHAAVETTLQDLGTACRRRADAMKLEVQGGYLASHRLLMDIAPSLSQNLPRQDDPKVRAIRATAEDRMEMFMAARQSAQGRLKPDKAAVQDEEVFAHQLHKRARLLNAGFQRKVFQVLKRLSSFNTNNHSEPSSEPSTPLASAQSSEGRGSPSFSGRTSSASDHAATFAVDDKRRAFQRTLSLDPTNRKWSLNSSCSSRGESPPSRGLHVLGERRQVHRRASDLGMWMHTTQHPHPSDADTPSSVSPLLSAHRRELTTADEEHSECDAASKEADDDSDDDDGDDKKEEEDDVVLGTSLTPSAALSALMAGEFHHQHDDADDTQPWMDRSTHAGRTPSSRPRAAIAQLEVAAMARRGIALLAAEERSVDDGPVSVRCVFDSCTEMHTEITRRHKALDLHLIDANFLPSTRTATLDANSHQRRARLALNLHFPLATELSGLNDGSEADGEGGEYHRRVAPQLLELATVFFSDIVGFTKLSASLPPQKVSDMLNRLYNLFDSISLSLNISKIDTIGDAYMAVTNLRNDQASDHALRMARFAAEAIQAANQTFVDEDAPERGTVSIRAGLHTGPIVASVVGTTNPKYTVFGDAVNTASRMESTSIANRIQCSEATALLIREQLAASSLGQGLVVTERGEQFIKGKGSMKTFWVKASASVELHMGPVKTVRRMLDTLATHHQTHHQAEHWPLSARILDPVRCSVVVAGPQGLIRVLHWLLKSPDLQVVHVRNAFALPASAEQYGSRHVTVHVIYGQHGGGEGGDGRPRSLKIIGEIQLHDAAMHVIRTKMAALQAVTSATSAEDMAIKCKDILRSQEAPALSTFSY